MKQKVALYSLGIGIFALGSLIYNHLVNGAPIMFDRLIYIFILPPIFGFFIWLRWDWATQEGEKRRAEKSRSKAEIGAEDQ